MPPVTSTDNISDENKNPVVNMIKKLLKKILPGRIFLLYHYLLAELAAAYYEHPSKKIVVIGVTGTKGKTSTANFIWSCLQENGFKTGISTTANIRIGDEERLNKYHMTMPGHFVIQKLMAEMVKKNCLYCVLETTSEGIKQYRHIGTDYDIGIFTNLSPEHLPSHGGSFEKYKEAKGEMFKSLTAHKPKIINGKKAERIIMVNFDSKFKDYFLNFPADKKITFGFNDGADFRAENIKSAGSNVGFRIDKSIFEINIAGKFNIYNALPAIIISHLIGIKEKKIAAGLAKLKIIPGRMESIDAGQNFTVFIDYAHEARSMESALNAVMEMRSPGAKIIVLLGAEGGGRDKAKRPAMGEIAAKKADYVVVSNVDPYDDDPTPIAEDIAEAAEKFGKTRDKDLFVIEDRREGIRKALSLAGRNDIVLITGKGAEQSIIIGGRKLPWDDRVVARGEILKLKNPN